MFEIVEPTRILKKFISNYNIVEINNSMDYLPKERVFPYGQVIMVFHYGSSSKFQKKNSSEYIEPRLVLCGQQTSYYDLSLSGKTGMIFVTFKPHGAKSFFDFPISELLNENLSMEDLLKKEAVELEDKLFNSRNNSQRIYYLESFLMKKLVINKDFERVEHTIKMVENAKGQIKIQSLAQEACLSIKQFERVFSKNVGLNPKKYISIVRFQHIMQMKKKYNNINLYQLAFDNGYYDQSHFTHDFQNLTGLVPSAFFNYKE
jgi:AraC-like DNA-binding protein